MIVNFRACNFSRNAHKLAQTLVLKKKIKSEFFLSQIPISAIFHLNKTGQVRKASTAKLTNEVKVVASKKRYLKIYINKYLSITEVL
jgi:hypothetical protein